MNTPTHDALARHAYELWQNRGCPEGCDTEIWLEAEQQLRGDGQAAFIAHVTGEMAAESVVEYHISPAVSHQEAIQAAIQKSDARAPQMPHHTGPKDKPPVTGKPVWPKAHSR